MLKDVEWSIDRDYKTGSENEPLQFYLDGLANSLEFNLLLGYFSSSAINLLSVGFATFISKGGKMKMVINHLLSSKDKEAINKVEEDNTGDLKVFDLTNSSILHRYLDEYDVHFFECLTYLILQKRIEIKVIKPKIGKGIAHYKSGVFSDGENNVGYQASCNFTLYGLSENLEQLEAFLSWENGRSNKLIKKQLKIIDDYFNEKNEDVDYLQSKDIEVVLKDRFGNKDINELLVQEEQLLRKKQSLMSSNSKIKKTISNIFDKIEIERKTPRFPYPEGPRPYQIEAYNNWIANDRKGLFAMATGTGKTLTSLNCLLNEYRDKGTYKGIILVPTVALLNQWVKECKQFNFDRIVSVSSKNKWEDEIAFINTAKSYINISYVIIVTYASFSKKKFQDFFKNLDTETLLIADEAHNLGANNLSKLLPDIHLQKRIGLSATPSRKYDEMGNNALDLFFNDSFPYIYSYSMEEAMANGFLCNYKYYPHIVKLNDVEFEMYLIISKRLLNYLDAKTGKYKDCDEVERLLLERKRIIHKAENKLEVFKSILKSEYELRDGDLRYTLVYVPEGIEPNYNQSDYFEESEEDISLINHFTKAVSSLDRSIMVSQFTFKVSNREDILKKFQDGKAHVLTSMKCLDEGVDVPRSELAIFCSSSGNPRQFIQRRGRVLRMHKDKVYAVLHDLVVVPTISGDDSIYSMEKNLIKSELERVIDFSNLSLNKMDTYKTLKPILDYYNLSLYDN